MANNNKKQTAPLQQAIIDLYKVFLRDDMQGYICTDEAEEIAQEIEKKYGLSAELSARYCTAASKQLGYQ